MDPLPSFWRRTEELRRRLNRALANAALASYITLRESRGQSPAMFAISKRTARKAAITTALSVAASVSIVLLLVPLLGGHPDGPGFWMSVLCPLVISGPASTWQFHQKETIERQRDEIARMHVDLEDMHAELRSLHNELRWKARRDYLTGGLNREAMFAALEARASAASGPVALLVIDADRFKEVNDTHGHLVGDEALRRIASLIAAVVDEEGFWGRIGGEEFLAFVPADRLGASRAAERLRRSVRRIELESAGRPVPLSVSIGCATADGAFDPVALFRRGDEDLYRAKTAGRDRIFIDGKPLDPVSA